MRRSCRRRATFKPPHWSPSTFRATIGIISSGHTTRYAVGRSVSDDRWRITERMARNVDVLGVADLVAMPHVSADRLHRNGARLVPSAREARFFPPNVKSGSSAQP